MSNVGNILYVLSLFLAAFAATAHAAAVVVLGLSLVGVFRDPTIGRSGEPTGFPRRSRRLP